MGTILSSNKDYNRILEKQPRKSIGPAKFDVPENFQQSPLTNTLSIPVLIRHSQLNKQTPVSSNELIPAELNPTSIQSISPIPEQKKLMHRSTSFSLQPNFSTHNQSGNNGAIVLSRSVLNLNNHRHKNRHNHFSSHRPNNSIIERNGKQFLTESHERIERRHVQIFDETIGQMRLFEVTDYIPSKTIRPMKHHSQFQTQHRIPQTSLPPTFSSNNQFQSQNRFPQNPLPPSFPSNNQSHSQFQSQNRTPQNPLPPSLSSNNQIPPPTIPNNRTQPAQSLAPTPPPSNLVDFKGLANRDTVDREFDLYHSGVTLPYNNNNNNNTNTSGPPLTTQQSTDSNYTYSQPKAYNTSTIGSQRPPAQYTPGSDRSQPGSYRSQPGSFRAHSPTASDYSANTSRVQSKHSDDDTDSEGVDPTVRSSGRSANNNRYDSDVAYRTLRRHDSPPPIDPFKKSVRNSDPYYPRRPNMNNYSQPIQYNRSLQPTGASDYAPIPPGPHNQSNRNGYTRRKDSNAYDD